MSHLRWLALAALAALPTAVRSADAPPAGKSEDVEVEARFQDGTVVRRALLRESIELQTKYGKLTVPMADVRRVEFGHHVSAEAAKQIDQALKDLAGERFEQREAASRTLIKLGRQAYPALEKASRSGDKEVAQRAREALDKVREEVPEEQLQFKEEDVVHTRDCVLAGRILNPALKARTDNFGELQLNPAFLASLQSMAATRADLSLDAAPFGKEILGKWIDTGLTVDAESDLIITADGKVDLVPQQAGQYVSGPEGHPQGQLANGHFAGTLLGRIGEKGEFFIIGKRFEGRALAQGKLYVHVLPTGTGEGSTGAYKVKMTSGLDLGVAKKLGPALTPGATSMSGYAPPSVGSALPTSRPASVIPVHTPPPGAVPPPPPAVIPVAPPAPAAPAPLAPATMRSF